MSIFLKKEMHFDLEHLKKKKKAEELVCFNKHSCRKTAKDLQKTIT